MDNPILTQWLTQPGGLATRLSAARTNADLTGTELAKRLGWSGSKVSRIQSGEIKPGSAEDIRAWLAACDATDQAEELVELLSQANARHLPWTQRLARGHTGVQAAYNELMAKSSVVTMVEMATIPGPLQTKGYAKAMLSAFSDLWPEHPTDIDAGVEGRAGRSVTPDQVKPLVEVVINEAALLGAPADDKTMAEQLDHLLAAMGYPAVDLMILELKSNMATVPVNSFNWYHFDDGPELLLVESFSGETEIWEDDLDAYRRALDSLRSAAVSGDEARRIINRARWAKDS